MDEKTARLRDIFLELSEEATVTERQEEPRGSLVSDEAADSRIRAVIERMRERFDFRTTLEDDELVTVVRAFYAGESDTGIARELGDESLAKTVARARLDLHLVVDRDLDAPFDLGDLRAAVDADRPVSDIAEEFDVSESTVRRYARVIEVQRQRRTVTDRFRDEFERIVADRDLGQRLTADIRETGLDDATEGMETNVSF